MFIFAAAFQQNTLIMSTTTSEGSVLEVVPASIEKPKKKFQVVPVPGEFTRGRWKVIDTRFGSAMGEFGNYPPDDEYGMIVTTKGNVITVRKKFPPPPSLAKPDTASEEADSIRVLQKSQPRLDQVPVTNQIKILIMDPETAAVTAQNIASGAVAITDVAPIDEMTTSQTSAALLGSDSSKVEDSAKLATATSNTVVAIDNKIVQAMDLVKTHLTFAVREEVETLRTTITDLEARLNALREENRLLRENVAPDVLAFITANKQIVE